LTSYQIDKTTGFDRAHLGDQGELWFAAALPRGWVWQPPRRDVGKDGLIVIRDHSQLHNLEFSVQIKTSEQPKIANGLLVVRNVPRASVEYWFASPLPTLVVAVDVKNRQGWFAWHLDLFDAPRELYAAKSASLTLRLPESNRLDEAGWEQIKVRLRLHYGALHRAIAGDATKAVVLAAVHRISTMAGNLVRIGANSVPDPPVTPKEGVTLLLEQFELRGVLDTVTELLAKIEVDSDFHKQLSFWLSSFEGRASAAHPSLKHLPRDRAEPLPRDFKLVFSPQTLLENRSQIVLAIIDLVTMLTSAHPERDRSGSLR